MRSNRVSVLATVASALLATSALAHHVTPPPSHPAPQFKADPGKAIFHAPKNNASGTWTPLTHGFPGSSFPDTTLLMNDGTVIEHDGCTQDWYRLTPDNTGSYVNGTWSQIGSMQSGYDPLYFASQVLPDGRVIMNGGEYDAPGCGNGVESTDGSLYDPTTNTWTQVAPPTTTGNWTRIGDAPSVMRTDGHYMLEACCSTAAAYATITGNTITWTATGTGKGDSNNEEGLTSLPDGTVLTVDANRDLGSDNAVEIYSEASGSWTTQANKTPVSCTDPGSHEIGPGTLLPSGLVYQICGTAHTAVFDPVSGNWATGPDIPAVDGNLDVADGPAAVLPDGNVLIQASPGVFQGGPSHFFEAKVKNLTHVTINQVDDNQSSSIQNSYEGRMMMLPTGQVLWASDVGDVEVYTPQGKPAKTAIPVIKKVKANLTTGRKNNKISGIGFNGVSFGGYYGDDVQESTNRPIVRFTNTATGHVCYANSHDYATGISDGSVTNAKFDIPNSCETGASTLEVVVNGVASKPKNVTLN